MFHVKHRQKIWPLFTNHGHLAGQYADWQYSDGPIYSGKERGGAR
jgi:hypothetical protein